MKAHPIARYMPLLIAGDERGLRALFSGAPRINDPWLGWVEDARFGEFVGNSRQGLARRSARVEHVSTTATSSGATEECVLSLSRDGDDVALPVAIAGDTTADSRLEMIRVYHSMWPLVGYHLVREPILRVEPRLVLPDVVGRYNDCVARGDLSGVLEQFAPGAEVREGSTGTVQHRGPAALRRFFTVLFSNGGGLGLQHCSIRDDGGTCAVESVVTAWGRSRLPHQAAASVFERADTGLLSSVRLYDDVEAPFAVA